MTLAELAKLHAETVAELEAVRAIADENGNVEQRQAANAVERLQQKLAKLEAKLERYPRAKGHMVGCTCGQCLRMATQGEAPATTAGDRRQVLSYYSTAEHEALKAEAERRGIKVAALQRTLVLASLNNA